MREQEAEHATRAAAIRSVAAKVGCHAETLRLWLREAERDDGPVGDEQARIKALEREVRELRQAGGILRKASAYSPRRSPDPGRAAPLQAMIAFIDDHRHVYGVGPICPARSSRPRHS